MKKCFFIIGVLMINLSGCSSEKQDKDSIAPIPQNPEGNMEETKSSLRETIRKSREQTQKSEMSAMLDLVVTEENGSLITIALRLKNPEQKDISAVRALVAYNPKVLSGSSVTLPQSSPFQIVAPGENIFDPEGGLVKIGVSASEGKIFNETETTVAIMTFERKQDTFTSLDLYGFGDAQKTVVLEKKDENTFQDILRTPNVPTLPLLPKS